jgi:hypothetical protein
MQPYHPSGVIPVIGGSFCLVGSALIGLGMGTLNAYTFHWVPFGIGFFCCIPIPSNFLMTLVCGMLAGGGLLQLNSLVKVRNLRFLRIVCVFACGCYFWAYWSVSQWASGWSPPNWQAWFPAAISQYALHHLRKDGWIVLVGWGLELIYVTVACYMVGLSRSGQPFCELCECWTTNTPGLVMFPADGSEEAWAEFRDGDMSALERMPMLDKRTRNYRRVDLASCPHCNETNLVLVQALKPSPFERNPEEKLLEAVFVPYQSASAAEVQLLWKLAGVDPPSEKVGYRG